MHSKGHRVVIVTSGAVGVGAEGGAVRWAWGARIGAMAVGGEGRWVREGEEQ